MATQINDEITILHLEDDPLDAELIRDALVSQGLKPKTIHAETEQQFRLELQNMNIDLILADHTLPTFDGISALKIARELRPDLPFVFVSGTIGEEVAIESLTSGATDYVSKQRLQRLGLSIHRALTGASEQRRCREADRALRASEERHRLFFEGSPLPLWVYDLETLKFLAVNEAAIEHYGYSRDEFLARSILDIRPIGEVKPLLDYMTQPQSSIHPAGVWKHRTKNGAIIEVEITSQRIDYFGRPAEVVLSNDVTERMQAEEGRRTSELRYRRLFESAKEGILILDARSGRIVDVNPFLLEMLDYSKEELVGTEIWEIETFNDAIASKAGFARLQQQGYTLHEDLALKSRKGLVRQVEFISNDYLVGDSAVIQCNVRDISDRKIAETALREANHNLQIALKELRTKSEELATMTQQLWQASKLTTMGELAASIAHELNNPLATVALRAEAVMEELATDDSRFHSVQIIAQEVERMAKLVGNLLQFSRRGHAEISTLDLREELVNSVEFIEHYLRSHKVEVVWDFASDLPSVYADRQQMRQVFLNLITNASDAMPLGGTLTMRAFSGELNAQPAVVVEFVDTGTGVQTGDLPRLWEPFFTTKPEGKGTGLGLAICRRTVEGHQGRIDIETGPGKGATVRITLPATNGDGVAEHE